MPADRLSVIVCRGCCCGSEQKHPDVDHDAQVEALRASLPASGRLWTVDCLGPCERSNVVVVRTRAAGRRWFGGVLATAATGALADWIRDGAVGAPPPLLAPLALSPDEAGS
ncbi:MAG TPA: hypothetical protein VNQ33_01475 [Acidimicrobiales bacterium]|nr:hypothetical protein [Acidimicrobiales bacterium]